MSSLNGRIIKLERQEPPRRIIVLWPGEELPADIDPRTVEVIRIVYVDGDDWRGIGNEQS